MKSKASFNPEVCTKNQAAHLHSAKEPTIPTFSSVLPSNLLGHSLITCYGLLLQDPLHVTVHEIRSSHPSQESSMQLVHCR